VESVAVVVVEVADAESSELVLVPGSVEEFASDSVDPAFGVGLGHRTADRGLEDGESFGSEDVTDAMALAGQVSADYRPQHAEPTDG
jgi:hypothetical protein